jgi:hypothetical protein
MQGVQAAGKVHSIRWGKESETDEDKNKSKHPVVIVLYCTYYREMHGGQVDGKGSGIIEVQKNGL